MLARALLTGITILLWQSSLAGQARVAAAKYGDNPAAGATFVHNGVKLYYEVYGSGEPVLMVHGNGASIVSLKAQIDHFRKRYRVIAMDSRDHGRSADSSGTITYEKMADDLAALLDHLKSRPVNVLGWSDGGIEALLLAIRHPAQVMKIASMAANVVPEGAYPEVVSFVQSSIASMPARSRDRRVSQLVLDEPHIDWKQLETIAVPTLILAGDHDVIRDEHTLEIYHHIRNSQLCIFPNATHMIPFDDPELFNATVERFFRAPFVRKDRVQDLIKSIQKMKQGE